mmetsp:Transcript_52843/g.105903  ORF Transcript_52843/g.105903 Transcript_52843/m.105903 type:complete len:147 (-) Transcript_52843:216-656(-)
MCTKLPFGFVGYVAHVSNAKESFPNAQGRRAKYLVYPRSISPFLERGRQSALCTSTPIYASMALKSHWWPQPEGHIERPLPSNHSLRWRRWPPWPQPGHATYSPSTGCRQSTHVDSGAWHLEHQLCIPFFEAVVAGTGFRHLPHCE